MTCCHEPARDLGIWTAFYYSGLIKGVIAATDHPVVTRRRVNIVPSSGDVGTTSTRSPKSSEVTCCPRPIGRKARPSKSNERLLITIKSCTFMSDRNTDV